MKRFNTVITTLMICTATSAFAQEAPSEMQNSYQGDYVSVERDVGENEGQTEGSVTVQTNSGYGGTRSFQRGYDAENQTASRSSSTTTNSGTTVSSADSIGCDGNGACTRNQQATGPNGQTVATNRSLAKTENGVARSAGVTGPNRSASTQGSAGYTAQDGFQRSSSTTGPQGNTATSNGSAQCVNSTCERSASQTGFRGQSRSVNNRTSLGEYGAVQNERNVTAPNGQTRTQKRVGRARRPR